VRVVLRTDAGADVDIGSEFYKAARELEALVNVRVCVDAVLETIVLDVSRVMDLADDGPVPVIPGTVPDVLLRPKEIDARVGRRDHRGEPARRRSLGAR
jgi:hypothetical protein